MRCIRTLVALATTLGLASAACAPSTSSQESADSFPNGPIELVVPFDPGASTDLVGRLMADALSEDLGVPVNVVNKPGASQVSGLDYIRKAAPDGYTLLVDSDASSSIQSLSDSLPFAWDDRTFVGRLASGTMAYVVPADSPFKTLDDLVQALQQNSEELTTNSAGGSTTTDMASLMLLDEAGAELSDVSTVPVASSATTMEALAAGNLDYGVGGANAAFALAASGDIRVLAHTGTKAISQLPDVPTTEEAGNPGLDLTYWVGLSGPPDVPVSVRDRLAEALQTLAEDPEVVEKMANVGVASAPLVGQEFEDYVHSSAEDFQTLTDSIGEGE